MAFYCFAPKAESSKTRVEWFLEPEQVEAGFEYLGHGPDARPVWVHPRDASPVPGSGTLRTLVGVIRTERFDAIRIPRNKAEHDYMDADEVLWFLVPRSFALAQCELFRRWWHGRALLEMRHGNEQ